MGSPIPFRIIAICIISILSIRSSYGQVSVIPFTSGPIPLCDTSTFTANVSGVGWLGALGDPWSGMYSLYSLTIDITSDHPQTLQIELTSPEGTTLLLSAFNGAGGANYTNTSFMYESYPSITTGAAPFTGYFTAQGGSLNIFNGELADGTWTITVIDTACSVTSPGPGGGPYTEGWFNGAAAGGFSFAFNSPPPPMCWGGIPNGSEMICAGGSANIQGYYESLGNGYSISVTPWDGQAMSDPYAATEPGTYWIDAYDQWDGCWYFAEFELTVGSISLGPDQVVDQCGNDPIDLNALFNFGSITPAWTLNGIPVTGSAVSAATTPGIYQVTDAAASNCSDTVTVTLNFQDPIDLGADQTVSLCAGSSADLTALYNTAGLSVEWQLGGAPIPAPIAATDAGTYTLVATSAEGCSDLAEITVTVDQAPDLGPDQNASFCSNATFDLTTLFTTTGLSTEWSYMMIPVNDPTSIIAGGTYQLIVSPGSACADTAFANISVNVAPQLEPDMMATTCEGVGEDLVSYFTSATSLSMDWTFAGAPVPDPYSTTDAGTYTLVVTNAVGCTDTANVQLEVSQPPILGADVTLTVCANVPVDLTALFNTASFTATWEISGVPVNDPENVLDEGAYVLTAVNTDGCSSTANATIQHTAAPALGNDQQISICDGATVDLTAIIPTNGTVDSWTLSGALVNDPASVTVPGSYRLIASDPNGCSDTAFVSVIVNAGPALGADQTFTLCPWQTVDLSIAFPVNGTNASYYFNGDPLADPTAVSDEGAYMIVAMDGNGCADSANAMILSIECLCVADFTMNARCMQDPAEFTLIADSAIVSARWNFSDAAPLSTDIDPVIRFTREGEILVTLEAELTCGVVNVERTIRIEDCSDSCTVWIPTAFTPNGDEFNDSWSWKGECQPEGFKMQIFDRFGEIIYTTTDPYDAWDGSVNGRMSPDGVYAYRVAYKLPYQDHKEAVGSIVLLR